MWFWKMAEGLDKVTDGNGFLCITAILGGVLLAVALVLGCALKNANVYTGVALLIGAGVESALFFTETQTVAVPVFHAAVWGAVWSLWLLTVAFVFFLRRSARRKRRLIASDKGGERLPTRGDTFVRARLHTVLRADEDGKRLDERKSVPYENRGTVRLGYARRLLAGVQDAPLSPAERLEAETLAQDFSRYSACEKWSAEELRAVNELFARLLKLSAKYSVGE